MKSLMVSVVALVVLYAGIVHSEPVCDGVLRDGVFDLTNIKTRKDISIVFLSELTSLSAKEAKKKLGLSGKAVIEGIPLGGAFSDEQWDAWRKEVRKRIHFQKVSRYSTAILRTEASRTILSHWLQCVRSMYGLTSFIDSHSEDVVTYTILWRPPIASPPNATITSFNCEGADPIGQSVIGTNNELVPGELKQTFRRREDSDIIITVNVKVDHGMYADTAVSLASVEVPEVWPPGWYGFKNSANIDRESELKERCSSSFTRISVPSGTTFGALCNSIGLRCVRVCDWEGNDRGCSDSSYNWGDGSRIGYCDFQ